MIEYFAIDNTDGYTQEELDKMNILANERIEDPEDFAEIQAVCEKIQNEIC